MMDAIFVSESAVTRNDSNPIQLAEHFPLVVVFTTLSVTMLKGYPADSPSRYVRNAAGSDPCKRSSASRITIHWPVAHRKVSFQQKVVAPFEILTFVPWTCKSRRSYPSSPCPRRQFRRPKLCTGQRIVEERLLVLTIIATEMNG